jgi:hypothetical protein
MVKVVLYMWAYSVASRDRKVNKLESGYKKDIRHSGVI